MTYESRDITVTMCYDASDCIINKLTSFLGLVDKLLYNTVSYLESFAADAGYQLVSGANLPPSSTLLISLGCKTVEYNTFDNVNSYKKVRDKYSDLQLLNDFYIGIG